MNNSTTAIEVYKTSDVTLDVQVDRQRSDVWLSRKQISELLGVDVSGINRHANAFKNEVGDKSTCAYFAQVTEDGKTRQVEHHNLDAILYIAYRVHGTEKAWLFRNWVSSIIKRYVAGDLRAAERATYEDVRGLIAIASDYEPTSQTAQMYFATIQNRLLYAVTDMTAADLIATRADHLKDNMGLTNWKGSHLLQADAMVGKNYLSEKELSKLQHLSNAIHAMAQLFAERGNTMAEWVKYIDDQIITARMKLLVGKGRYSHDKAVEIAKQEYMQFKHHLKEQYVQLQLI